MIALVLSSHPLQAPQYLPDVATIQNQVSEKVDAMNVTTYEQLLQKLKNYEPKMILVLTASLEESAYRWIPEVMGHLNKADQTLFILPKSEMDRYHLQIVIQDILNSHGGSWQSQIRLLGETMSYQEVADHLAGREPETPSTPNSENESGSEEPQDELSLLLGTSSRPEGRKGHVITLTGPGSSGTTSFMLYHVPFLATLNPEMEFLMVDINDDKKDLVAATDSQNYRLSYYKSAFQKKQLKDTDINYHVPYKKLPNLKVISAVQDQYQWTPNEIVMFLNKARKEFDVIFFDMGELVSNSNAKIRLMKESNEVIAVVRPDTFSLNRTLRYMNILEKLHTKVIISHFDSAYVSVSEVEKYLGLPVLGVFPYERGLIPKQQTNDVFEVTKKMQSAFADFKWETELKVKEKKRSLFWLASSN